MSDPKVSISTVTQERGYPKEEEVRGAVRMSPAKAGDLRTKAGAPELALNKQGTGFLQGLGDSVQVPGLGGRREWVRRAYFNDSPGRLREVITLFTN